VALLLAGTASANHHQFRLGVVEGSDLHPVTDVDAMGAANVEVLRFPLDWGRVEVDRGQGSGCNANYNWGYYDLIVSNAADAGVRLLPFVIGSPGYVSSHRQQAPATGSRQIEDYKCFVAAAVERYGRGGSYFEFDSGARPITDWQIWNEPNLKEYAARGRPDPREYAKLLKLSGRIIEDADPRAQIILAGMPEIPGRGIYVHRYLEQLYKVRRIEREFDAVAMHPYARNWRGVEGALIRLNRTLKKAGDARRTVWVTEYGWSDFGPKDAFQVKGPKGQATQLAKATRMMRSKRRKYDIGTVTYFRWRDTATRQENGERFDYAGLYKKSGSAKRSCRSFIRFSNGNCPQIEDPQGAARATSGREDVLEPQGAGSEPLPSPPE
jgi:hypothetical protein